MGLVPPLLKRVEGLKFSKMLGSGSGDGFRVWPDFGRYGLLMSWESQESAERFFAGHDALSRLMKHSERSYTLFMKTIKSHGTWDGLTPFQPSMKHQKSLPIGVLTRASIKWSKMFTFWRAVPGVSRSMSNHHGNLLAVGIGELPLIQQATFSVWQDRQKMIDYAYRGEHHAKVVKMTRRIGWYKEELFARFHIFDLRGQPPEVMREHLTTKHLEQVDSKSA